MNLTMARTLIFCLTFFTILNANAKQYNILDYGAVSDKETLSTEAIQKAIDDCYKNGGGTVLFPTGEYMSGTVFLKDNITLYLEAGATWYGSTDTTLFPVQIPKFVSLRRNAYALIFAEGKKNIAILGNGTIHGQGGEAPYKVSWGSEEADRRKRPKVLNLVECSDILIRDVTFIDSPHWMLSFLACDNINIDGVTILNLRATVNNDGIDLDCCRNAHVSNCYIKSEDDAIVLKSTANRITENVSITNCILSSHCNAFKCGTESSGGFRNITFSNNVIYDIYLSGIALEIVDGGEMNGVIISNISMRRVNNPIFIKIGDRARKFKEDMPRPEIGSIKNVIISNIQADQVGEFVEEPPIEFSHTNANPKSAACQVSGLPGHYIENVTLKDIRINFVGGAEKDEREIVVPENPGYYPEFNSYGPLPAYGFFGRHVKNLRLENVELTVEKEDHRYAFVLDDIQGMVLDHIDGEAEEADQAMIKLDHILDGEIQLRNHVDSESAIEIGANCTRLDLK